MGKRKVQQKLSELETRSQAAVPHHGTDTARTAAETRSAAMAVFATTAVLTYAAMTALFPAAMAPAVAAALDIPAAAVGLQISLVYCGAMVSSLVGGALTRRTGACRASQIALVFLGGGAVLAAVPTVLTFAAASLLIGLGYGLTNPAASHLLARFAVPARRGLVFSIKQTGVPLGGVLAGALAPTLAVVVGWQMALVSLVLVAAVAGLMLQLRRVAWDHDRDRGAPWLGSPLCDIRLVWANRALRYLSLAGLCFAAVQLSVAAFTVTLLVEDLRVSLVHAGFVMAAVQTAGVVGRVAWGWVADTLRSGVMALVLATLLTIAAAVLTSLIKPGWPLPLTASIFCVLGFSALGWNGVYLARVAHLAAPDSVASASGGSLFFTFSGVLLGPPAFAGLHLILESYTRGFAALAGVAAAGLLMVLHGERSAGRAIARS